MVCSAANGIAVTFADISNAPADEDPQALLARLVQSKMYSFAPPDTALCAMRALTPVN